MAAPDRCATDRSAHLNCCELRTKIRPCRVQVAYFLLSKLRAGLPNGNGLPPTDTMAVPRYP